MSKEVKLADLKLYVSLCPVDLANDVDVVGRRREGEDCYTEYEFLLVRENVSIYGFEGTLEEEKAVEDTVRELMYEEGR